MAKPLWYYQNNITGTLNLCELMNEYGCKRIIFSSSATVYGSPETVPIKEDFPLSTTNPYGSTKLMLERINLRDFHGLNELVCYLAEQIDIVVDVDILLLEKSMQEDIMQMSQRDWKGLKRLHVNHSILLS